MLFNREHQMGIKGLTAERRISYKIPFSHNDVYGSDDSCRKVFVFSLRSISCKPLINAYIRIDLIKKIRFPMIFNLNDMFGLLP